MPFAALGVSAPLLQALSDSKYCEPTPVQAAAIPAVLRGRDVWACAQTGSGKTAAFAVPILQRLGDDEPRHPRLLRALILVPTRELAAQVGEAIRGYGVHLPASIKAAAVFGGVSINPQMMALRGGVEIVVATPGRLLDLVDRNALRLDQVATLVLDEADRLFELGFAAELARITGLLPRRRQNLLFSATFPPEVHSLASELLHNPVRIEVPVTPATAPAITQRAIRVDTARRTQLLRHLIAREGWGRVLVFVATKYATEHVAEKLRRAGILATAFHGELAQSVRSAALADFKAARITVLVATDVAARGIDVVALPVVVNFDLPRSAVDYVHRIGRTGRAGATGVAVSFVSAGNEAHFHLIEKRHAFDLPREIIAGFEPTTSTVPDVAVPTGGVKGKRKSKKDKLREAQAAAERDDFGPSASAARWPRRGPSST
jgi:ATP-dependent RNA helicase RhlE